MEERGIGLVAGLAGIPGYQVDNRRGAEDRKKVVCRAADNGLLDHSVAAGHYGPTCEGGRNSHQ